MRTSPSFRTRQRAHAVLLSARGYRIGQLTDIFEVDRDTIARWLDRWERDEGLDDAPRSGRPRVTTPEQQAALLEQLHADPKQLKASAARLDLSVSLATLKRIVKRAGYSWRRVRRSLRAKRDERAFREAQADLARLQAQEDRGEVDLYYFDAAGFSRVPAVPYAWQAAGHRVEVESVRSPQINVLGWARRSGAFESFVVEGTVCSQTVVACIDAFCAGIGTATSPGRERVLVLDGASVHRSAVFKQAQARWLTQGVRIYQLPGYSPELNLIELVWQAIKYRWLPFSAYESMAALRAALDEVLVGVGTKYRITFA